jgi:MerR family transcriptional regulator, light-induced transcriptional regulator
VGEDLLSAGAVARRLGVAVTTLRSWHRRYGLGPSAHEAGQHRRYTTGDLERLEMMQRLVSGGVPPGEAARWALHAAEASVTPATVVTARAAARSTPGVARLTEPSRPVAGRPRDGGGYALPLGRADPAARGLARASLRLDTLAVRQIIADSVTTRGIVRTWDEVLRPVLVAVGERAGSTGEMVEVEHVLSGCISAVFAGVPRPPRGSALRILLACTDEEQHSLPIEALAAALAARGVACRVLGARVPLGALLSAVRRTGPVAVLLWSHERGTGDPAQLATLLAAPRRPALVAAAGPGWDPLVVPEGVATPSSLEEAVRLLTAAARS